ncbi:chromate transporter [Neobacillus notoginsengisoli]|uniref:Chromate transporter n=1 Tax=Neobacillus notoginsengisoli TaxID=1578198 RepID=A0A417YRR3_9BACI|nr:chromate transporter [Neobacillus notoginsengisoli]RHW37343.1 chromate transporter [Neobacillus notoginsengisoli]
MIYMQIFWAFFLPGILGYGGGPSSIPLIQAEVVDHYGWMTNSEFSEVLAMGNALPGPIATKMAGYIGYEIAGTMGAVVGVFASVAPSLALMIGLVGLIMRHKESPKVKRMTTIVRPVIAALLAVMAYEFFVESYHGAGILHTGILAAASLLLMEKMNIHPAYVIAGSLLYGAIFLA